MRSTIRAVAGVGPLVFFTIATIEGLLRAGYDPVAQPISALALGPRGIIQEINFAILAVSLVALAWTMRAALGRGFAAIAAPGALVVMAIGVVLAGLFPMDAPGSAPTPSGELHMAAGFLVFPLIPVVVLGLAIRFRRDEHWRSFARYTLVTGLFCLATLAFFLIFVGPPDVPRPLPGLVGVVQRVLLLAFFAWGALAVHHATRSSGRARARWRADRHLDPRARASRSRRSACTSRDRR